MKILLSFSKELTENFTNELKLSFDKNDKITFEDEMLEKSFLHCEIFYTYIEIIFKIKEKDYFILIHPYIMKNIENISNSENYEIIEKQYNGYKEIIFSDVISSSKITLEHSSTKLSISNPVDCLKEFNPSISLSISNKTSFNFSIFKIFFICVSNVCSLLLIMFEIKSSISIFKELVSRLSFLINLISPDIS